MDLTALIAQFRVDSDDTVVPPLASDTTVTAWLNEAQQEACIRARLIHDTSTAAVCNIAVTAPARVFTLHAAVIEVTRATFTPTDSTDIQVLHLTDTVELDRLYSDWRTRVELPRHAIQTDTTLRLGSIPDTDGTITLEAYRLPIKNIEDETLDTPEIGAIHHRHLVQWAIHKHFSRPDADIHDPTRSDRALAEFTRVFGVRPDADNRKFTQANRPNCNKAIW